MSNTSVYDTPDHELLREQVPASSRARSSRITSVAITEAGAMLDAKTRAARQFMYHCAWRVTQDHDIVQGVSMLKAAKRY